MISSKIPHPGTLPLEDELASPMSSPKARSVKSLNKDREMGKLLLARKDAAGEDDLVEPSDNIEEGGANRNLSPVPNAATAAVAAAPTRIRHKSRSNADLAELMGGSSTSTSTTSSSSRQTSPMPGSQQVGVFDGSGLSSSANSTSTVSSTSPGAGVGITLGGPPDSSASFKGGSGNTSALSSSSGRYTGYSTSSGGGGEGHYSAVSSIRPKKQAHQQQTDSLFMVRTAACVGYMLLLAQIGSALC